MSWNYAYEHSRPTSVRRHAMDEDAYALSRHGIPMVSRQPSTRPVTPFRHTPQTHLRRPRPLPPLSIPAYHNMTPQAECYPAERSSRQNSVSRPPTSLSHRYVPTDSAPFTKFTKPPTYSDLAIYSHRRQMVLRVHDASSHCPLRWTGELATSGFRAPNRNLHLTPTAYEHALGHLRRPFWAEGPWTIQCMARHVLGEPLRVPRLITRFTDIGDEPSSWISATASLDWAIWDVARRLASAAGPGQEPEEVRIAVIRTSTDHAPSRQQPGGALWALPAIYLERALPCIWENRNKTAVYRAAAQMAKSRQEMLYYGRIFADSIVADVVFTRTALPFRLPEMFFRQDFQPPTPGLDDSWLGRLRWDPRRDEWETARIKLREWYPGSTKLDTQLVHQYPWKWPCGEPNATPRRAAIRPEANAANRSALASTAPPTPSPATGKQRTNSTASTTRGPTQGFKPAMTPQAQPRPPATTPQPSKRVSKHPGSAPTPFLPHAIPIRTPGPAAQRTPAPVSRARTEGPRTHDLRSPAEGRSAKAKQRRRRAQEAAAKEEDNLMSSISTDPLALIPPMATDRWLE